MAEPLNATFFALRKRDKSGVLTGASIAYLIMGIVLGGAFLALNFASIGPLVSWYGSLLSSIGSGQTPTAETMPALPAGVGVFFLSLIPFMFFGYVLLASYEAACLRWMIRGETGGFMGLTLGGDTWRVYSTYWVWFFLYIGFSIVMAIVSGAITFGVVSAVQDVGTMLIVSVVVECLRLALMLYLWVRLAPAAAVSVGRRKFSFFTAWTVTRGRFWALFGAFFLIFLIFLVIEIVVFGVAIGVALGPVAGQILQLGANPDPNQMMGLLAGVFTPQNLIVLGGAYAVVLAAGLIVYVLAFGINSRAVLAAAEEARIDGVTVADTFA